MQIPHYAIYVLTAFVLLAAYFRHSVHGRPPLQTCQRRMLIKTSTDNDDPYKCGALTTSGQWIDPKGSGRTKTPYSKWQPDGCLMKAYNPKKTASCLKTASDRGVTFIGDSTVRELFWAMARKLDTKAAIPQQTKTEKHVDINFKSGDNTINFYWDPFLNSSHVADTVDTKQLNTASNRKKNLVVLGSGLWFARHMDDPVEEFKRTIDTITLHMPEPSADSLGRHRTVLMPVQPPFYENLDADHKKTMRPDHVEKMNDYLLEIKQIHDIEVMESYLRMVDHLPGSAFDDKGLHVKNYVWDVQADMLLNLKCNDASNTYPFDGTCCYSYPLNLVPLVMMLSGAVLAVFVAWVEVQQWAGVSSNTFFSKVQARLPTLWPIVIMWAGLTYCFLADRTQLFEKVQKLYNPQDWYIFLFFILLAGGLTIKASATPTKPGQEKRAPADQPFLSRDQTDEWKGWMQLLILAYHYTGGSKVLGIYKIIRLLVASYLFMTGYGHAAYFYQKSDFSLKRVVAVNFRINLLSMLLPWIMDADYLFYYFAPLVTYWYAVIFATMAIQPSWNQRLPLLLTKMGIACALTTFLHTQPWLLDPAFKLINAVFGSKWDATEWLFRCRLDQFIVYIGMLVSILNIRLAKPPAPPAPPQSSFATTSHTVAGAKQAPWYLSSPVLFLFDALAIATYVVLASAQHDKNVSNLWHTYISPLPILAFIHLRNASRLLRNHYSTAYAWVGKISLETFVLQYHIWLAADTKGLLSLGLFGHGAMGDGQSVVGAGMGLGRWADCLILGVVFVWVSKKVADATGGVSGAAVKAIFPGK